MDLGISFTTDVLPSFNDFIQMDLIKGLMVAVVAICIVGLVVSMVISFALRARG